MPPSSQRVMYPVAVLAGGLGTPASRPHGRCSCPRPSCRCSGARSSHGKLQTLAERGRPTSSCSWVTPATRSAARRERRALRPRGRVRRGRPTLLGTGGELHCSMLPPKFLGHLRRHPPRRRLAAAEAAFDTSGCPRCHDRCSTTVTRGQPNNVLVRPVLCRRLREEPSPRRRRAHRLRHAPLPAELVGLPGTPRRSSTSPTCCAH